MNRAKLILATLALLVVGVGQARAGLIVGSLNAGPFGDAQVQGFTPDNQTAYTNTLDQTITNTVTGFSGDTSNSASYTATQTYFAPSSGSQLMSSGDWSADTSLSTLTANVGAGITIDAYVQIAGGQSFTISGKMKNAGITFLDPDGHNVFPYFDNYFSGSEENVSLSGTLTESGTYRLDVTSSISGGGAPDSDAHYSGNYDLTFSVYPASAVPEPSTLTLLGIGSAGLVGYGWRRRRRSTRE